MAGGDDSFASPAAHGRERSVQPIRVLHVEDDATFADLIARQLERRTADDDQPLSVVTETDPTNALSQLDDVDCVVSDYDMPALDGLELLDSFRERDPDVPFLLFTGRGSEEIASRAISAGVTDYLRKDGQPDTFVMLANRIQDAVARYRAERDLERSRERLRRVVDVLPQCLFVKDRDGQYLLINERGAARYGLQPEAVEGRYEAEFLDADVAARFNAEDRAVIDSGNPMEITEQRVSDADGEEYVERVRKVPFPSLDGSTEAVLGVATDVTTEHRLAERCGELVDLVETVETTLDETVAAHDRGDSEAVAAGHDRLGDLLVRLRRVAPADEVERLLGDPPSRLASRAGSEDD